MDDDTYILRSNIMRFERMLEKEQDPQRRATVSALLAEERSKLETRVAGRARQAR